jgi:TonB family protein
MRARSLGHPVGQWQKPAWLILLFAGLLIRLEAQTALYVQDGAETRLVQAFLRGRPLVQKNGKLVEPATARCSLQKVEEYVPVKIIVRKWEVRTSQLEVMGTGDTLNKTMTITGELEAPTDFDRVFLVLDLKSEDEGRRLVGWEVGRLEARSSKTVDLEVPMAFGLGEGNYELHFYVNGREVFHSNMPMGMMDAALRRMVGKRIEGVNNAEPQPFVCPAPEFPKSFKKSKDKGVVTVSFRILPNGSVLDPKVISATHPELTEPTLDAVRLWYFLPRVRNGRPVEAKVQIPVSFAAPEK